MNKVHLCYPGASFADLPNGIFQESFIIFLKGEKDQCWPIYWQIRKMLSCQMKLMSWDNGITWMQGQQFTLPISPFGRYHTILLLELIAW